MKRAKTKKFPLLKDGWRYPNKPLCPQCKKAKVWEPNSFAVIMGGALRVVDKERKHSEAASDLAGFLELHWHGAHVEEGGVGADPDSYAVLPLAADTVRGQFDLYFCSTRCLRAFFNECVDALEARVAERRKRRK